MNAERSNTHSSLSDARNRDVQVYINGELLPRAEAKISVFDSGYLCGDGIWEGLRLHHGRFAFLERHLDRLVTGCKTVAIALPMGRAGLVKALEATVRQNKMFDGAHVRLMVTRGTKVTPSQHPDLVESGPNVVVIAEHKQADPQVAERGLRLFTSTVRRPPPDTLDAKLNCHSKLHEVVALLQAYAAGADEALMLDVKGGVATCNATNFFLIKKGVVKTSGGQNCLPGVTRGLVLELCREHGIDRREGPLSLVDVYDADEAFVTGTFGGLTPVVEVDGRSIGEAPKEHAIGPLTERLRQLYAERLEADVRARPPILGLKQ